MPWLEFGQGTGYVKPSPFLWFHLTHHIEICPRMEPVLGEEAQARAATHQGRQEEMLSRPCSTLPSPWAWPHKPHSPMSSSGITQENALVHPPTTPRSLFISQMGCISWMPLSPSTVLLYRAKEFRGWLQI